MIAKYFFVILINKLYLRSEQTVSIFIVPSICFKRHV